jgi:hypothetical protein
MEKGAHAMAFSKSQATSSLSPVSPEDWRWQALTQRQSADETDLGMREINKPMDVKKL